MHLLYLIKTLIKYLKVPDAVIKTVARQQSQCGFYPPEDLMLSGEKHRMITTEV
jgi:hypothetical protein